MSCSPHADWCNASRLRKLLHAFVLDHLFHPMLHGDGTNRMAKKGGDGIDNSGCKHQKGEKLLPQGLKGLKQVAKLTGLHIDDSALNLDDGFDSARHREVVFNAGMIPNMLENPCHRKTAKRGRKRY